MATLRGWAVPIGFLFNLADHTYVSCDGGYKWPCWGGSTGGSNICTGKGGSAQANCISEPWSTAMLVYGVTGVCHQTANRILWPAGALVSAAGGYWASWLTYGTYGDRSAAGLATWLGKLAACGLVKGEIPQCAAGLGKPQARPLGKPAPELDRKTAAYYKGIQSIYAKAAQPSKDHLRLKSLKADAGLIGNDFSLTFDFRLGKGYPPAKLKAVLAKRARHLKRKDALDATLHAREIKGRAFAEEANKLIAAYLKECAGALGAKDYTALTGLDPAKPVALVDPDIAEKVYAPNQ